LKRLLHATKLFQRAALRKTRVISKYLPLFLNLKVRSDSYVALAASNNKMERLNERVALRAKIRRGWKQPIAGAADVQARGHDLTVACWCECTRDSRESAGM
jgi:hypothetical protein